VSMLGPEESQMHTTDRLTSHQTTTVTWR